MAGGRGKSVLVEVINRGVVIFVRNCNLTAIVISEILKLIL